MYKTGMIKMNEVPIPVISVGNITLGGTGKTPVVERLSRSLKEAGFNPAIVTRGYKRKRRGVFPVDVENDTPEAVGDEAYMLAKKTLVPVIVGSDRAAAIHEGIKRFGIDIALLDDGFQVRNIRKDVEILVVKPGQGRTNRKLFPLGPNREPLSRIGDATVILVNGGDLDDGFRSFGEEKPVFRIRYRPAHIYNLKRHLLGHYNFLKGMRVLAFAGLGDNASFFTLVKELGANVVHSVEYPDHYAYEESDLARLAGFGGVDMILTTEKDGVKLAGMNVSERFFYLAIETEIEREDDFFQLVLEKIRQTFGSLPIRGASYKADA